MRSLRGRLLALLLGAVLAAWVATAVFTYFDARHEIDEMLEAGGLESAAAERDALREELARSVASHLMHPLAVGLPALAVLVWLAVGWGLRPLQRIAREVDERDPENLSPLDDAGAPREALPLLRGLNALFARVAASMDKERRFTADAAHELRTPLAALKTQAQVARGARSDAERARALDQVIAGVDRAAHLVEQLLVLARLDPGAAVLRREAVRLDALAAACIAEMAPAAAARGIDLGLEGVPANVSGDPVLLGVLLRNLVDNALRYTPPGGTVTVSTGRRDARALLVVEDTGPGIPPDERGRVMERFYRVLGSGEEGSGLGLSIARRVAELHRAELRLGEGDGGRGLRVELDLAALSDR